MASCCGTTQVRVAGREHSQVGEAREGADRIRNPPCDVSSLDYSVE